MLCQNCESDKHKRCCARCGRVLSDKRAADGNDFCSKKCEDAQAHDDRISAAMEADDGA